jgi:hypothetical protein
MVRGNLNPGLGQVYQIPVVWILTPLSGPINSGHGSSKRRGMDGWIWSIIQIPD